MYRISLTHKIYPDSVEATNEIECDNITINGSFVIFMHEGHELTLPSNSIIFIEKLESLESVESRLKSKFPGKFN